MKNIKQPFITAISEYPASQILFFDENVARRRCTGTVSPAHRLKYRPMCPIRPNSTGSLGRANEVIRVGTASDNPCAAFEHCLG